VGALLPQPQVTANETSATSTHFCAVICVARSGYPEAVFVASQAAIA